MTVLTTSVLVTDVLHRELLLDGVEVTAAVRPDSLSKANTLFADKTFVPEGTFVNNAHVFSCVLAPLI